MKIQISSNKGFSLTELMIASVLATSMSLAVVSLYINQTGNLTSEKQRSTTSQEAHRAFDMISRLIRQAEANSIRIRYSGVQNTNSDTSPEIENDAIDIVFTLPSKQDIWPNTNSAVSDDNAVRLKWDNNPINSAAYQIQISNSASIGALNGIPMKAIAGSNGDLLAKVINFDFWPLLGQKSLQAAVVGAGLATNGYLLKITTRSALPDLSYINPNDKNGIYKNYRTYTVSGVVTPRNIITLLTR